MQGKIIGQVNPISHKIVQYGYVRVCASGGVVARVTAARSASVLVCVVWNGKWEKMAVAAVNCWDGWLAACLEGSWSFGLPCVSFVGVCRFVCESFPFGFEGEMRDLIV